MTERKKKLLSDILHSIELIADFTNDIKSFTTYSEDLKTKGAVERHLLIIGDAVHKFLKESNGNTLESTARIISIRNLD